MGLDVAVTECASTQLGRRMCGGTQLVSCVVVSLDTGRALGRRRCGGTIRGASVMLDGAERCCVLVPMFRRRCGGTYPAIDHNKEKQPRVESH